MILGIRVRDLDFLLLLSVFPLPHMQVFLTRTFLLFPDGANLTSMNGEAQDQVEAEVKGSVSQKKAIATLKVTGCQGEGILFGFWTLGCH